VPYPTTGHDPEPVQSVHIFTTVFLSSSLTLFSFLLGGSQILIYEETNNARVYQILVREKRIYMGSNIFKHRNMN
jgi:hypothetical protein